MSTSHPTPDTSQLEPENRSPDPSELRRERWLAGLLVATLLGIFFLILWLASLGGGAIDNMQTDYYILLSAYCV